MVSKENNGDEYLVAKSWRVEWGKFYLELTRMHPGPIDNTSLLLKFGSGVRPGLYFLID
jgi:hypothetical protein